MIKQKAPKDMTANEFIDLVEKRYHTEEPTNMNAWINTLRMIAEEPAPNPFTKDQIAWMREEQRSGMNYAAVDGDGDVCCYRDIPEKGSFFRNGSDVEVLGSSNFLSKYISWEDTEPLCFADYAPLEEKTNE